MDWEEESQEQRAGKAMDNGVKVNTAQMPAPFHADDNSEADGTFPGD